MVPDRQNRQTWFIFTVIPSILNRIWRLPARATCFTGARGFEVSVEIGGSGVSRADSEVDGKLLYIHTFRVFQNCRQGVNRRNHEKE